MLNRCEFIGNLGKDPEIKSVGERKVAQFSVATTEKWKDGGESKEKTEWHNIVAWSPLAEVVEKYLKKGSKIYIAGKLTHRKYDDKDGVTRYVTEVVAREIDILSWQNDEGGTSTPPSESGGGEKPKGNKAYDPKEEIPF